MNEEQPTLPAFPDARSKNLQSRVALFLIAIVGNIALICAAVLIGKLIVQIDRQNGTKPSDGLMPAFL